ncbi:Lipase 5 [Elasticomyces elasticus]|nr:Lipase 5 [Elasticomyces elasticus]
MDFLRDATALPGSTRIAHGAHGEQTQQQRRLRLSRSEGGLLRPLVRLVREPVAAVGNIVETLNRYPVLVDDGKDQDAALQKQLLYLKLKNADNYDGWEEAARQLDMLEGNSAWKLKEESVEYDVALVKTRLEALNEARISRNPERMLFLIRTSLTRSLGGMGDLRLYKHSHIGTKALIERYIDEALRTLDTLVEMSSGERDSRLDGRRVMEQLLAARQAFGRSALLLSGGGTLGMNHIGVIKSLFEADLLPRIISGASAGSIVCAVLCTKTDAEIPQCLDEFCYGDLTPFERKGEEEGLLNKAVRFFKYGALYDNSNLVRVMKGMVGDITFQEAYNRTRRILNICVSTASLYELPRLLNYVTSPNVIIWSAVAASCSVPFIFSPAQLLAKDPRTGKEVPWNPTPQHWIDGSVDNDLPMTRLAEMFNVNHFVVSQVNPHVVPFLAKEENSIAADAQRSESALAPEPGWLYTFAGLAKGEALHRMHVLAELGVFPNTMTKVRSVLGQKYSGDITIFPEISYAQFPDVLRNPSIEFMEKAMLGGERATWPKLSRIRNHCAIELALDDAVQQMRAQVVFSRSQVDLRMYAFVRPPSLTRSERENVPHAVRDRKSLRVDTSARLMPPRSVSHRKVRSMLDSRLAGLGHQPIKTTGRESHYLSSDQDSIISSSPPPETCDEYSDNALSDSTFDSPPSPQPALWPSTRQLFPSASQPVTPSIASKTFNKSTSPSHSSTNLAMTLTSTRPQPSFAELEYKRLFHTIKGTALSPIASRSDTPDDREGEPIDREKESIPVERKRKTQGLHLDISGTRGMVRRRRRSSSTGMKGLRPPGKQ